MAINLFLYRFNRISEGGGLRSMGIITDYVSLIWTTRAISAGDFQLTLDASSDIAKTIKKNDVLCREENNFPGDKLVEPMVVEKIRVEMTEDGQFHKVITGRSIVALWDRRNLKERITPEDIGTSQLYFYLMMIHEFALTLDEEQGRYPNFPAYIDDRLDPDLSLDRFILERGDNVLTILETLAATYGFKLRGEWWFPSQVGEYAASFQTKIEAFANSSLTMSEENGMVRSYSTLVETALETTRELIGGQQEQQTSDRVWTMVTWTQNIIPFDTIDQFIDANDIRRDNLSVSQYQSLLQETGKQRRNKFVSDVQLGLDTSALQFPQDLALGQSARIETRAFTARVRLMEIIDSVSEDGAFTQTPTFSII